MNWKNNKVILLTHDLFVGKSIQVTMKYCKFLLVSLFIILTYNLFSNHLTGGDLSYKCIGENKFEFTLVLYNECESIVQLSSINFFEMQYSSASLGITPQENSFTLFKTGNAGGEEIKFFCPGIITKCNFGGTARGMKKYTYTGTVTLPEKASDWKFVFQQTARSTQITTAETNLETDYIIEATLNTLLAPCNNSPQFDLSKDPVTTGYTGKETSLFIGGTDPDNDEIIYSFSKPKTALNDFLDYKSGYSEVNFVSSDMTPSIDKNTGHISLTPNKINEIGITDVLIQEFREGELIASITRGVQVITTETNNNEPELSGWLDTNKILIDEHDIYFCTGDEYDIGDFSITSSDPDGDNLSFSVSPSFYQSNFILDPSNGQILLNWGTEERDTSSFTFTIISEDDNCPESLKAEREYTIHILPVPVFDIGEDFLINCNDPKEITPNITSNGTYTYLWQDWETTIVLDDELIAIDTLQVPTGFYSNSSSYIALEEQKIALTLISEQGCQSSRFISANDNLKTHITIANFCYDSISPQLTSFNDGSQSPDFPITSWQWNVFPDGFSSDKKILMQLFLHLGLEQLHYE